MNIPKQCETCPVAQSLLRAHGLAERGKDEAITEVTSIMILGGRIDGVVERAEAEGTLDEAEIEARILPDYEKDRARKHARRVREVDHLGQLCREMIETTLTETSSTLQATEDSIKMLTEGCRRGPLRVPRFIVSLISAGKGTVMCGSKSITTAKRNYEEQAKKEVEKRKLAIKKFQDAS